MNVLMNEIYINFGNYRLKLSVIILYVINLRKKFNEINKNSKSNIRNNNV